MCNEGYAGEECTEKTDVVAASDVCECSMNCTVLCLRSCAAVHEKFGIFRAHECFYKCNHACVVGCVTRGVPDLESYEPEVVVDARGVPKAITPAPQVLFQGDTAIVEDRLPTMY